MDAQQPVKLMLDGSAQPSAQLATSFVEMEKETLMRHVMMAQMMELAAIQVVPQDLLEITSVEEVIHLPQILVPFVEMGSSVQA